MVVKRPLCKVISSKSERRSEIGISVTIPAIQTKQMWNFSQKDLQMRMVFT
jgi:hypothetical protein